MSENYDQAYGQADLFGSEASPLLSRFSRHLSQGASVLDIGVGQGRNALPLARSGFTVTGIDPSAVAVRTVSRLAATEGLPLTAIQARFEDFQQDDPFEAMLCFGLMQILDPVGVGALAEICRRCLAPAGLLFLTAWHVGDPSFARLQEEWKAVGNNCFRSREAEPRHRFFLGSEQILEFFPGWEVLHHWEGMGPWHRHVGGPRERHGDVEAVFRRPEVL